MPGETKQPWYRDGSAAIHVTSSGPFGPAPAVIPLPPQAAPTFPAVSRRYAGALNRLPQPTQLRFRHIAAMHSATSASAAGSGTTLTVSEGEVAAPRRV